MTEPVGYMVEWDAHDRCDPPGRRMRLQCDAETPLWMADHHVKVTPLVAADELAALRANIEAMAVMNNDLHNENDALRERVAEAERLMGSLRKPPSVDDPIEWVGVPNDWWPSYEKWTGPSAGTGD
jgi:hypothetical protein